MTYCTEREGILVTQTGQISLRHDNQLRRIARVHPAAPARSDDDDPAHYDVWFADGTTAVIGRPIMRAALMRRMYESNCTEF